MALRGPERESAMIVQACQTAAASPLDVYRANALPVACKDRMAGRTHLWKDKPVKHYLLLVALLLAALVCYGVGLVDGSIALFAVGAVLELSFWFRLFRRRHRAV
jgi:hypothetical protein